VGKYIETGLGVEIGSVGVHLRSEHLNSQGDSVLARLQHPRYRTLPYLRRWLEYSVLVVVVVVLIPNLRALGLIPRWSLQELLGFYYYCLCVVYRVGSESRFVGAVVNIENGICDYKELLLMVLSRDSSGRLYSCLQVERASWNII